MLERQLRTKLIPTGLLFVSLASPGWAALPTYNQGGSAGTFHDNVSASPPFVQVATGLTGVGWGSAAWGDSDNDGDLDVLLTGVDAETNWRANLYRNDGGGSFVEIGAGLAGVDLSSVAWGDSDNDGDLDILLTGRELDAGVLGPVTKLYRNDGAGSFVDIGAGLTAVMSGSVAWGDSDNDGDLDILLTGGFAGNNKVAELYRNDGGGSFTDIGAGLTGVQGGSVAWGDSDNDGDLDILLTGEDAGGNLIAELYRNDGGGSFVDIGAPLAGVVFSSVAWGDSDNDGDLDILLAGQDAGANPIAKVYRNDGGGSFVDIGAELTGVRESSVAWGDSDNDGDLDILLTGLYFDLGVIGVTKVYRNDGGGSFVEIAAGAPDVVFGSAAWGDSDNDGDLDILLAGLELGVGFVAEVYDNLTPVANTPPTAPTNLATSTSPGTVAFSWDAATDAETPSSGLSYNLRVGTTPGGNEISAAMADGATGYRRVPALGNANQRVSWTLKAAPRILYWSVQAVDAAWAGSAFAPEEVLDLVTAAEDPNGGRPTSFSLMTAAPNPFRLRTTLRFELPRPSEVRLSIYDVAGRLVRTLVNDARPAGRHRIEWAGRDDEGERAASGVYLVRLEAGDFVSTQRMVLLK